MKKWSLFIALSFLFTSLKAQQLPLIAHFEGGKLFISHTVAPKENWYSIGRMYNVSPKELAPFNGTSIEKGLAIGQTLKVPLTAGNFTQSGGPSADEVLVPLHHVVEPKEGLYHISQAYGKVPLESLRNWNKLNSDNLSTGTKLIIGYLQEKKEQSPLASAATRTDLPPQAVKTEHKAPAVTPTVTDQPVVKPETKSPATPVKPVSEPKEDTEIRPAAPPTNNNGGVFRAQYEEQARSGSASTLSGTAAIFKSTSGWKDAKYYALMNKVTPGTIVRVTNPANSRTVYAKVLGEIPPGKENEGLMIRISNAAASELSLAETARADLQLSFVK